MKLNHIEAAGLHMVALFNRLTLRKPQTLPAIITADRESIARVAKYMAEQASDLRVMYDENMAANAAMPRAGYENAARMYQAGAAGAEAMSQILLAVVTQDRNGAKAVLTAFVQDALPVVTA